MDAKFTPFLPLTVQQATLKAKAPKLAAPTTTVSTNSGHYQSANVNQQIIHRPISQIVHK